MKVATGIAIHTGMIGSAGLPFTKNPVIGMTKNIWIRYIPKDSLLTSDTSLGVSSLWMHVNMVNAPNEARSTFGVQNSHAYSIKGRESAVSADVMLRWDHAV